MAIPPTIGYDLRKVRTLCARLGQAFWMTRPLSWAWARPDGRPQGPALIADGEPGLANLLWLALDMHQPPREYDASKNPLYCLLMLDGGRARLNDWPLFDVAAVTPLPEFLALLPEQSDSDKPAERAYPLLRMLGERRLRHA